MNKQNLIVGLLFVTFILAACAAGGAATPTPTPQGTLVTSTLPGPGVTVVSAPDPRPAARAFFDTWQAEKYTDLYDQLTKVGRDAITQDALTKRFTDVAINLTLQKMQYEILSSLTLSPTSAQVSYRITYQTAVLGDITRDSMTMNLSLENGSWKVQWDDGLILPELRGGNHLQLDYKIPSRGDIYDRSGNVIAAAADAVALGVIPGQIDDKQEQTLLDNLAALTGKTQQAIKALYANAGPNWYVAVGEATAQDVNDRMGVLQNLNGLILNNYRTRYYFDGGVAPNVTGYVQFIPKEDLILYQRKGYQGSEKVGMVGLEKYVEDALAGVRGAKLYVISPSNQIVTSLGQRDSQPAQWVYTTIDKNLQVLAQKAITGFRGAIVVLERNTGRVLAMVSAPGYDPNLFDPNNFNSQYLLGPTLNDPNTVLLNRAAMGTYPLGSVFKIITMSAALESGVYTAETTYVCGSYFTELEGVTLKDWTVDHKQPPSGTLTLPQGLMRSCNPYFYHIGLDLYRQKGDKLVTDMARGFGLGAPTGINEIEEQPGNIPDPVSELDAVHEAIGQGAVLVTPLQVARFVAAIGNGGTLFRPQVIEKITSPDGVASFTFKPEAQGTLPVSQANLNIVRAAMKSVVENRLGTAYYVFTGMGTPIYGKTGTAETTGDSHAWFAGYTDAGRSDKPDIAIAVICENAGEGSEVAAPIFRRIVEDYFNGRPSTLYPWESNYYVKKTPAPTDTPTP